MVRYTAPRQRTTPPPNLRRMLGWSLGAHIVGLLLLSFSLSHVTKLTPAAPLQVKLVGVPQPKPAQQKKVVEEKIRTQDSPAPKDPPPDPKNMPQQDVQSKFAVEQKKEVAQTSTTQLVKADERPPVLDKNPKEKKVVKNEKDAKVVQDPDDFLKALDFVDNLKETSKEVKAPAPPKPTKEKAGEGKQLQLNLSEQGAMDGISGVITKNWNVPTGMESDKYHVTVEVQVSEDGTVTSMRVTDSSGVPAFDSSLLRAIKRSSPLPIPRDSFEKFQTMDLQFTGAKQ